jgi:hypothetical protein
MRTVVSSDSAPSRWSIDALLETYVCWREECHAVRQAYQGWVEAERGQRGLAYAGYVAVLDREEQAARAYADQVERVGRMAPVLSETGRSAAG